MPNIQQFEIQETLFRFMRAFDNKDWQDMHNCLDETIYCDYSTFRKEKPGEVTRDKFIALREKALADLKTQHNLTNLSFTLFEKRAEVLCNYAIYRFHPDFSGSQEHFFHSYGQYHFGLVRNDGDWRIATIVQTLLISDGNEKLHGALK